jgi:hypothetical protein
MPREVVGINLSGVPTYEACSFFLATVAHPGSADGPIRERLFIAFCRETIKATAAADQTWGSMHHPVRTKFLTIGDETAKNALKTATKELNSRFVAAQRLFFPFLAQLEAGHPIKVAGFPVNVERMANLALGDLALGSNSLGLVKTTAFKPSRPVLHAAAALVYFQRAKLDSEANGDVTRVLMHDPNALAYVVQLAEKYRLAIPHLPGMSPKNPIREEETIQFVLN